MEVTNRFKGLELIDRVPEELWLEVCDIVPEAVIKTIPVTVFIDQDLGTGVDEKKDTGDTRLE